MRQGERMAREGCGSTPCMQCGWYDIVARRRAEYLKRHGLTKCEDGLYRLVMPEDA